MKGPMDKNRRRKALASISGLSPPEVDAVIDLLKLQPKNELALFTDLVLFAQDFGLDVKALAEHVAGKTTGIQRRKRRTSPVEGAWRALIRGDRVKAESLAKKLLKDVDSKRGSWDRGNLIHHGNLIMGHIRLREEEVAGAEEHLLAAGRTPGSPQLNSFGPNMTLAKALLERDRTEVAPILRRMRTILGSEIQSAGRLGCVCQGRKHS